MTTTPPTTLAEALAAIHAAVEDYARLDAARDDTPPGLVVEWVLGYATHIDTGAKLYTGNNLIAYPDDAPPHRIAGLVRWATLRLDRLLGNGR